MRFFIFIASLVWLVGCSSVPTGHEFAQSSSGGTWGADDVHNAEYICILHDDIANRGLEEEVLNCDVVIGQRQLQSRIDDN